MHMMEEFNFFLRLQMNHYQDEIFFNQRKYVKEPLNNCNLDSSKNANTLMVLNCKLDMGTSGRLVPEKVYRGAIEFLLKLATS